MSKKFLYLFKEGHDAFGGDQTTMKNIPHQIGLSDKLVVV